MPKDPYKIVNSKPGWASKLASGGVAIGSVATAIVITVPGLPGYETLSQALASGTQQEVTNPNAVAQGPQTNSISPSNVPGQTPIGSSAVASDSKLSTVTKVLSSSELTLSGISSANTSSPTPAATAYSSGSTGSQAAGNVSSPTTSGSNSEYEDNDYEDDEHEDDEDDD